MQRMKQCTRCGRELPLSEFGKHRLGKNGLNYWCRDCNKERAKIFRSSPSGIYTSLKGQSKFFDKKPVPISRKDFVEWYNLQSKKCVYCDIPEEHIMIMHDYFGVTAIRLTVDCKDNSLGYFIDNIVLACANCNRMKNNMLTFDEMMYVGQNFVKPKWQAIMSEKANENEM